MSDFDREAERRRLEEKYERDREKRKSTQRMSELLLKGATMTNQHCDDCGSPIFRYEGQEFCPTCQAAGEDLETTSESAGAGATAEDAGTPEDAETTAGGAADGQTSATADATPESVRDVGPGADETETSASEGRSDVGVRTDDAAAPSAADDPEHTAGSGAPAADESERRRGESTTGAATPSESVDTQRSSAEAGTETSGGARDALLRALRAHADRAAETTDPRRAKEHLAAAREAAEALSALDR